MLVTALLERGIAVPGQVEVVPIWPSLATINLGPPLLYYPVPSERFIKEVVAVTERYFESGQLPPVHKRRLLKLTQIGT